jgi:hypothetical protein
MEVFDMNDYYWVHGQGNFGSVLLLCKKEKPFEKKVDSSGATRTSYSNKRTLPEFVKR